VAALGRTLFSAIKKKQIVSWQNAAPSHEKIKKNIES
jgi:hypothetical protein